MVWGGVDMAASTDLEAKVSIEAFDKATDELLDEIDRTLRQIKERGDRTDATLAEINKIRAQIRRSLDDGEQRGGGNGD